MEKSETVKRYFINWTYEEEDEHPDGDWVKYSDVAALAAQVRTLEKENEGLRYIGKEIEQHLCRILGEPYPNPDGEWKLAGASSLCESVGKAIATAREETEQMRLQISKQEDVERSAAIRSRVDALEEAAKEIETITRRLPGKGWGYIIDSIRALKPTTEPGGGENVK